MVTQKGECREVVTINVNQENVVSKNFGIQNLNFAHIIDPKS
jgi:hypothetical protein